MAREEIQGQGGGADVGGAGEDERCAGCFGCCGGMMGRRLIMEREREIERIGCVNE